MRVIKPWSRRQRDCAISILGDSKNLSGDSPGKPFVTLRLALLWAGGWTRGLSHLKLFCDSLKINLWTSSKMESWFLAKLFHCFHCCACNKIEKVAVIAYTCHVNFQDCGLASKLKGKNYSAASLNLWQLLYNPFVGCLFFYRCILACLSQRS